ncbi:Cytosolic carboxypeptidase 2 [Homalodisca vitripennis]|nr:Cytosolic carboxypeptidase 2 [Homalodisca vitripennis]
MFAGSYLSSFLQNTLKSNQVEINTDSRTLRPIAKLREPRELFALPKELDCPQQAARWPAECQGDFSSRRVLRLFDTLPVSPPLLGTRPLALSPDLATAT